jgi:5-methylcytosine-specific restriction endonuclease McrA
MKEWAKEFYHSKDWIDTRRAYLISQHYLCERCGEPAKVVHHKHYLTKQNINNADIALNWDNLEALCQDCHNKEHHAAADTRRYKFDADGNIIQAQP